MAIDMSLAGRRDYEAEIEELAKEFRGVFSQETIERYVGESRERLAGARIDDFVPLFVHRFSRERLRALAQTDGSIPKVVPEVLFVCVHNAGRSQMAAGLLRKHADGKVHVRTAGSQPAGEINPVVVEALREVGVDIEGEFPKPLTDEFVSAADVVVTMGCGDACPIYPGRRYEDWELEDPEGRDIEGVRLIRDELDARVRALVAELTEESAAGGP